MAFYPVLMLAITRSTPRKEDHVYSHHPSGGILDQRSLRNYRVARYIARDVQQPIPLTRAARNAHHAELSRQLKYFDDKLK
jgi:hypothetical protein